MEKEKVVIIAERVKAFAIGFIGICFFSLGTSYFEEQSIYRVPRILLPVFNLCGNVGLAIGLIILGGGLIFYGYTKWKKFSENGKTYFIAALPVLVLAIVLSLTADFFKDRNEGLSNEERRENLINEIKDMGKPNFKNKEVAKYFAGFDSIHKEFQEKIQAKDESGIQDCEQKYMDWSSELAPLMEQLSTDEKVQIASYNAKLAFKWQETRESFYK
jgi:hypothetical protein